MTFHVWLGFMFLGAFFCVCLAFWERGERRREWMTELYGAPRPHFVDRPDWLPYAVR